MTFAAEVLRETWHVFSEGSLYVLAGFLAAGLIHEFLPTRAIARHMGGERPRSALFGALLGAPVPLCSCGVLPAAVSLREKGASRSATLAFVVSTPETGVDSIALTWALLGPVFAVVRPLVAIATGVSAGLASLLVRDAPSPSPRGAGPAGPDCGDTCGPEEPAVAGGRGGTGGPAVRMRRAVAYGFGTILDEIAFWLLVGFLLTGFLTALIPDDFFSAVLGWDRGFLPMLAMAVVGVPLYLCASASTPVAAALVAKGLSPGAALVFLLVGPATNVASVAVVGRLLGAARLRIYLASIVGVSLAAGWILDATAASLVRGVALGRAAAEPGLLLATVKAAAAVGLIALIGYSGLRTGFGPALAEFRSQFRPGVPTRRALAMTAALAIPLAGLAVTALVAGSAGSPAEPGRSHVPRIVTTIEPLAMIARDLAPAEYEVRSLLPPGASPHAWSPRPSDLRELHASRLLVRVGGGLDDWCLRLLAGLPDPPPEIGVLDSVPDPRAANGSVAGPPGGHDHPHGDPHVWLDPVLVRDSVAPAIARALDRLEPARTAETANRLRDLAGRLTRLDARIREILDPAPGGSRGAGFVAFHSGWHHFGRRYGLVELGVVERFGGAQPTPRELAAILDAARAAGVPAILVEPQLDPRVARVVASDFGAGVVTIDPLGDPADPARATYDDLMLFNARAVARAVGRAGERAP